MNRPFNSNTAMILEKTLSVASDFTTCDAICLGRKRTVGDCSNKCFSKRINRNGNKKNVHFAQTLTTALNDVLEKSFPDNSFSAKKQVRFATVISTSKAAVSVNPGSWFDDQDYSRFQLECQQTVMAVRFSILTTGIVDALDSTRYTLHGLEQFLSPSIERARATRCRRHVVDTLLQVERIITAS